MIKTTQAQFLLTEWARWRRIESGEARGYPHQTPFRRLLGGSLPTAAIESTQAEEVDRAVCRLIERCPDQGSVITMYYLEGMPLAKVAKHLKPKVSYESAARLLAQGETAIDYILHPEY